MSASPGSTSTLKVSLAQINPVTGDIAGNAKLILKAIARARREECDLVVTPELCLTGYCLDEKLLMNEEFLRQNRQVLEELIAAAATDIAAIVGFVDFDPSLRGADGSWIRYNAAAILQGGRVVQVVHKRLLPAYRYFEDKRYFQPGTETEPARIRTRGGEARIGVLICEDLWDDEYRRKPAREYRDRGARFLFCINASPFAGSSPGRRNGKRFRRLKLLRRQATELGVPIAYLNTCGIGDNGKNVIVFDGGSLAVDRAGHPVRFLPQFEEAQESVTFGSEVTVNVAVDESFDREREIFDALVLGLRDYDRKIGAFEKVIQPVSGGVDSALGTAIAFEAVGPERLTLYNLPSRFNSEATRTAAARLARNFGLEYRVVPIEPILAEVKSSFETHLHQFRSPVTLENLQSRIRGLLMMAESNDSNSLLLSNGNATEIALGYATLYGDMAGGLAVIGDLSKPDVYRLARYVNSKWGREMIPREVIEAVPSAELSEGQTDPFDYTVVGPLVSDIARSFQDPARLRTLFRERRLDRHLYPGDVYERYSDKSFGDLAEQVYGLLQRSVYKRLQGAPIIAVSERAFGFDLRETLINNWGTGGSKEGRS